MKIYRLVPNVARYGHPWRGGGRWWPKTIDLGAWMEHTHDLSQWGFVSKRDGSYTAPDDMPRSDFPLLSLQLPVMSERAADRLGCHPGRSGSQTELAERLRSISINGEPYFAVQPLFAKRGEPDAFLAEASRGIEMPRGEVLHYHTLAFDPARIRGELFTLGPHEPYSETYVTEAFVERVRAAGLTGLDHPELVYDDGPVSPSYVPVEAKHFDEQSWYARETWELFYERGSMASYFEDELQAAFQQAQRAGLVPS